MRKGIFFVLVLLAMAVTVVHALSYVSGVSIEDVDSKTNWFFGATIIVKIRNSNNFPVTVKVTNLPGGMQGTEEASEPVTIKANSFSDWIDVPSLYYSKITKQDFLITEVKNK
ncbi:MAG: hypothetical protein LBO67_06910 [Spirochaetaceae bacterium]|nr:hypothetical protein [Spirochaetaceae bacterium]